MRIMPLENPRVVLHVLDSVAREVTTSAAKGVSVRHLSPSDQAGLETADGALHESLRRRP